MHRALLGRPSGCTEGDIRRGQGDLGAHVARWRGLGRSRTSSRCAARHAASFRNFAAPARTDDRRTNDATSGPQEWLTGSLHDGGIRSVRSPLRRAPLPATPIATPLQCGRPKRPGLSFNFSLLGRSETPPPWCIGNLCRLGLGPRDSAARRIVQIPFYLFAPSSSTPERPLGSRIGYGVYNCRTTT